MNQYLKKYTEEQIETAMFQRKTYVAYTISLRYEIRELDKEIEKLIEKKRGISKKLKRLNGLKRQPLWRIIENGKENK